MALQLDFQHLGMTFPRTYCRLTDAVMQDKTKGSATVYIMDEARVHGLANIRFDFVVDPSPDAPNIHTQAYEAAKLLPEFAGAVDV